MRADKHTEIEVMATLQTFAEAWASRDIDAVLGLFGPDPDVVVIGSGLEEKRMGRAELREQLLRDWARSEAVSVEFGWHLVSASGVVAWVTADMMVHARIAGKHMTFPGRLTAVLEKRRGKWKWMQSHFSLPAVDQVQGALFPPHAADRKAA
jgi:ketosteroid isomerase-like protein